MMSIVFASSFYSFKDVSKKFHFHDFSKVSYNIKLILMVFGNKYMYFKSVIACISKIKFQISTSLSGLSEWRMRFSCNIMCIYSLSVAGIPRKLVCHYYEHANLCFVGGMVLNLLFFCFVFPSHRYVTHLDTKKPKHNKPQINKQSFWCPLR